MANQEPFRVLIAGAGIGGLATAVALSRISGIPNLDIQLYEQADELLEIGASIALSPNGMRTLEKLGVTNAFDDDAGFRGTSGIPQIIRHWKSNQVVAVDTYTSVSDSRHQTTRFHRGHIHAALLKHVPTSNIHLGKKTVGAKSDADGVTLLFEDGTEARGHVLIGADGIKSKVRQAFVPEHKLKYSGKTFARATFDASILEGKVPDLPEDAIHWWGLNDHFFASKLGKGQFTTVGSFDDPRSTEEIDKAVAWNQADDVTWFKEKYKNWNPTVKALSALTPYIRLYPNYVGDALSSWVISDRATLVGDAAHTHGGSFAAGGSLALDDSLALALAFKHVILPQINSPGPISASAIKQAIQLYDNVRRPHTTRLLEIVHGQLGAKKPVYSSESDEDAEKSLQTKVKGRPNTNWLSEHDVEDTFLRVIGQSKKTPSERARL
ncbi:unnamed protein product [Clonostachys rhizophaga]|uniref:FAD-binding domain-containing protein n=1 Tax=Clonostachys rhizophaga TaxID=160324 RepID=A0A9N9YNH0_9HYPO|nr:unnamed protein product [Clonostachys rhizophaga]